MSMNTDSINDSVVLESKAASNVKVAAVEGSGNVPFTIELLLNAAQRERVSLDAIEQSMDTLRRALAQRRRVIDERDEILRDLSESLITRRR